MMPVVNNAIDLEEINQKLNSRGLIDTLLEFDCSERSGEELISKIAVAASRSRTLLSQQDIDRLKQLSGFKFFDIQIMLCKIIPYLDRVPGEVMELVRLLVEKGGDDLAANHPNAAFRNWCAMDTNRADDVIKCARAGDPLALRHLVFALEAKEDVKEAFCSAESCGEQRIAGVLALSRLRLSLDEAERAVEHILSIAKVSEAEEAAGLLMAALEIGGKHPELVRGELANAIDQMSGSEDPIIVHSMATALHRHHGQMTSIEVESCISGMLKVDAKNKRTISEIDAALQAMWQTDPLQAGQTAATLIAQNDGGIGIEELEGFFSGMRSGDPRNHARLATEWLLGGEYHVCSTLGFHLSEIDRTKPCVDVRPDDLPSSAAEQIFICRKAIGFLFNSPMTAASWIVAVLRGGHPDALAEITELLFNPLLLNYGGALRSWLEDIAQLDGPEVEPINSALERARVVWDGFEAAQQLVELEPPASHRALSRFQEAEENARMQEMAREKSIFAQLITAQPILYGDQSSFNSRDIDGNRRPPQSVQMSEISVTT